MTKKYETLAAVLSWCKSHPNHEFFYYYDIGINTHSIAALCDTPFKGRVWLRRRGVSKKRDTTRGLVQYALATNARLDID